MKDIPHSELSEYQRKAFEWFCNGQESQFGDPIPAHDLDIILGAYRDYLKSEEREA